jgi:hypothetical protein
LLKASSAGEGVGWARRRVGGKAIAMKKSIATINFMANRIRAVLAEGDTRSSENLLRG